MRTPDFSSLRSLLEKRNKTIEEHGYKPKVVEYAALANAMTWFCREVPAQNDQNATCCLQDALVVMALLIDEFGPQTRLSQSRRNLGITARRDRIDRFSTTLSEEQRLIADAEGEEISSARVADIFRGRFSNTTLAEFVDAAIDERDVTSEQITAARDAIVKIRHRLMQDSGKGEAMRARICVGFGTVGKTELAEENYLDVKTLLRSGPLSAKEAIETVAKRTRQNPSKVKTDHQRIKAKKTAEFDNAVGALNKKRIVERNDAGEIVYISPLITRKDMDLDSDLD